MITIACMGKRKKTGDDMPPEAPTAPPSKRKRTGRNLNVWIDPAIMDAFDRYVAETEPNPTNTSTVETALKRFLGSVGYWPPQADAESE